MAINPFCALLGLLAVQSSDSLVNVSGFRNLEVVGALVIANMGNFLANLDGFNSLFEVSILIITRNNVSGTVLLPDLASMISPSSSCRGWRLSPDSKG